MARTLTSAQLSAMHADSTNEAFLTLITLSHPDITTVRWVNNTEDVTSNGNTFTAAPFEIELPDDNPDQGPKARLRVSNVDRAIVDEVRSVDGRTRISAKIEVIMASDPDDVIATYDTFDFRNVSFDAFVVEGDLTLDDFLNEPWPSDQFNPSTTPGLF